MKIFYFICALIIQVGGIVGIEITEFSFILKPSSISSRVGVFATKDIPNGTKIVFFPSDFEHRKLPKKEIPDEFLYYCVAETNEMWFCPQRFDRMEIAWYLNHSDKPNIKRVEHGTCYTLKEIKKGEEILIDFNDFNEPEDAKIEY